MLGFQSRQNRKDNMVLRRSSLLLIVLFLFKFTNGQDPTFATDCFTPNNKVGMCIEIQKCETLLKQVVDNNEDSFEFIRASSCGPPDDDISMPKVCCGPDINFIFNERGKTCTTPNGERAQCSLIYNCPKLYAVVEADNSDPAEIEYLQKSLCEYDSADRPIVCCGSDTRLKNILPDRSDCGTQEDFRILNGNDTEITEFPWMALLQQTKNKGGSKSFGCGGVLISPQYVLTAAHCVTSQQSKVTSVRLGEWDLDTVEDCVSVAGGRKSCSLPPQDIGIGKIITHEGYYRDRQRGAHNDIALIRLARPASLNDFVRAICLPLPSDRSSPGESLFVAGWGATLTARYSRLKQKLLVPVMAPSECKSKFGTYNIQISEKQLCAGGEKQKDSCKGDSGGPLMAYTKSDSNQFYVEGIVSFGTICGTEGWPGVYTKVTEYLDWIKQNVAP